MSLLSMPILVGTFGRACMAQLIKTGQCIKSKNKINELIFKTKEIQDKYSTHNKNFYVTSQETIQTLLVLAYVFQSIYVSAAIVSYKRLCL